MFLLDATGVLYLGERLSKRAPEECATGSASEARSVPWQTGAERYLIKRDIPIDTTSNPCNQSATTQLRKR